MPMSVSTSTLGPLAATDGLQLLEAGHVDGCARGRRRAQAGDAVDDAAPSGMSGFGMSMSAHVVRPSGETSFGVVGVRVVGDRQVPGAVRRGERRRRGRWPAAVRMLAPAGQVQDGDRRLLVSVDAEPLEDLHVGVIARVAGRRERVRQAARRRRQRASAPATARTTQASTTRRRCARARRVTQVMGRSYGRPGRVSSAAADALRERTYTLRGMWPYGARPMTHPVRRATVPDDALVSTKPVGCGPCGCVRRRAHRRRPGGQRRGRGGAAGGSNLRPSGFSQPSADRRVAARRRRPDRVPGGLQARQRRDSRRDGRPLHRRRAAATGVARWSSEPSPRWRWCG